MSCILVKADGKLKKAISDHYKDPNKAEIIINDMLLGNTLGDSNFHSYLEAKSDVQTYEDGDPTLAEFVEWSDYLEHQNKINKRFSTINFDTTTKEFLELSEGFTVHLMSTLFDVKGFTPNDLFEEGAIFKINENNALNNAMNKVKSDIREYEAEDEGRKNKLLEALDNYPANFYKAYKGYLESTFKVSLDVDAILSDAIESKDLKETKDSAFSKNAFEFDQKATAPNSIKIMIAGLPNLDADGNYVTNDLGLPPAVDYDKTFNFIQQALVELPGDIGLMTSELTGKANIIPALDLLVKRLNFGSKVYTPASKEENYSREQLLRTQFVNQFNKSKNEFNLHIKNEDGTISVINSNLDKVENSILKEWENNFKAILSKNPNAFQSSQTKTGKGKEAFLRSLGIELSSYSDVPTSVVQAIKDYGMEDSANFKAIFTPKKNKGVKAQLKKIASIKAKSSFDALDFQHFNAEGKAVYGITLNTYLTSLAKELRYYAGTDELTTLYPEIFEADYNQNSEWLHKIKEGDRINVGVFDGFISKKAIGNTKASKDLKGKDLNVQRITGMLMEGKYTFLRSADRSTENYFYFEKDNSLIVNSVSEMQTFLLNHLIDEMGAMTNQDVGLVHYNTNNRDFRAFHILENGVKKSLLEVFNPKITTIRKKLLKSNTAGLRQDLTDALAKGLKTMQEEDLTQSNPVFDFIDTMMDQIIEKEQVQLNENGVLEMDNKGEYLHISEAVKKHSNVENVVSLFALNSFASAIEQTKVFTGDLALFKNPADIFKRMSMLNSTKESARVDSEVNAYLNSLDHLFTNRTVNDSTIVSITLNDIMSKAADFSGAFDTMLKDVFGKDYKRYSEAYNDINEADGFAYMTYDEYRIASIRFGEWLPSDQALYEDIAGGNTDLVPEVMRRATVKKYQYTGKLVGPKAINAIAVRKFAIMPLIPGAIPVGSVLDKLNTEMINNGVGMAFYESAAKAGHGIFENEDGEIGAHSLYDSKGNFQLDLSDNYDILDYKYMGNQLKIHNDPKERITASTQKRKLVESNFYENGKLVDDTLKGLLDTYNDLQSEVVQDAYEKMIEIDTVDALIEQGLKQGYTTNELKSLAFLKQLPIVDALPNKQRLENLIMARLSNKVIANKRKGDSVAQVPDVGFEITDETAALANRHNLQFYRKSKDGKRLLPMEIMIALPTDLINYVATQYGDGTLTQDALDAFNEDIAADNAEFEETGRMSDLDNMTTYVGYRVPNQVASSSDVAKVKKFLPPYMGAAVVVPKQIVAKTGSDFDIDKLNLYKPHYKVTYSNEETIQKDFIRKHISTPKIIAILKELDIQPASSKPEDIKTAFVESVLESGVEFTGETKIYKELYEAILAKGGVAEKVNYIRGSKKNKRTKENLLLQTEIAITLHNANWKQLLAPITDGIIQGVVKKIRGLRGQPLVKQDHISDVFTNAKNIEKFISFLSGKGGVGQVAVHITNHVLAQKSGLKQKALHNYFGFKGDIELGRINNDSGQQISEILSELLTAYVDIAKDDYILDINAIQSTANTILMMARWGMKPETIFLFMNQPIILDYVKEQALNESVITDKDNGRLTKNKLVTKVLKKWGKVPKSEDMIHWVEAEIDGGNEKINRLGKIYDDITSAELSQNIKADTNAKKQAQMLDLFLEYQRQSVMFQKMISSSSPDTKGFKGVTALENQIDEAQLVRDSGMFVNYDKLFDSFIGEYQNVKEKYFAKVQEHFISQNPLYKGELDGLKELTLSKTFGAEAKDKALSLIDNEFVRFIVGRGGKISFQKGFQNLFTGENSIPKVLQKMQVWFDENGVDNVFIEQLLPLINTTEQGFDNLKFKTKRLSTIQKETLEVGFKALKEYDESGWIEQEFGIKNFYQSLIAYQMIQTGIGQSPLSIMEAIPAEDYFDFMKEEIVKYSNQDIGVKEFTGHTAEEIGEFILHHPELYYNKFKMPFQVEWSNSKQKFVITMYGDKPSNNFSFIQQGNRHFYAQYGTYPEIVFAPKSAITKYTGLQEIADNTHYKYQLSNTEVTEIRPELEKTLVELLESIGADVEYVNQITDRNGDPINAYGRADLMNQVIQVTKDRHYSTLPEEAAHMITGMLGKDHPLMRQMMSQIHKFPLYEGVLSEYANVYQTEEDFRFEAVGKMIASHMINGVKIDNPQLSTETKNWFQRLLRKLSEMFFGKDTSKLKSEMDIFEIVADKITTGKIKADIADASETNVDRRTRRVAKMFNMNDKGLMPNSADKSDIEAMLKKERLPMIGVHKHKEGYMFHKGDKMINPIQEYFQMRETVTQQTVVDSFVRDEKLLSPNKITTEDGKERYIWNGKVVPGRVSDATSKKFASNKSKAEVEMWNNKRDTRISSAMGTYLHEKAEEIFNNAIDSDLAQYKFLSRAPGTTRSTPNPNPVAEFADGSREAIKPLNQRQENVIATSVDYLAQAINKQQEEIDPNGKAVIRLENFVITKDGKTGGSQDVTVIYSDGSASIYDYKNIGTLRRNAQNKIEDDTTVSSFKLDGYNLQISTYMRILRNDYGITKFRDTRILPFALQYSKTAQGKMLPSLNDIEGFTPKGDKQYLMPIPVVKELTDNPTLNKILTSLFVREESLEKDIKSNWGNVSKRDVLQGELSTLKKSITAIQVRSDVAPLIDAVEEAVDHISQITKDNIYTTDNIGELNKLLLEVKLFNSIFLHAKPPKSDKALTEKYNEVNTRVSQAEVVLAGKLNEALVDRFGDDLNTPQKEIGGLAELFSNFSQINQPIFEAGRELVKKATGDTNRDVIEFTDKVETEVKALKEWTKGKNISLMDAYKRITSTEGPNAGNLIGTLSGDFYSKKKEALQEKDHKWLQSNFELSKEGKQIYKEDLALFKGSLKKGSKLNDSRTKAWELRNDLANSNIAWTNRYALNRYTEIKNEEKHHSKEYKELLAPGNEGLKRYYDFYIESNRQFNQDLAGHDSLSPYFVANVRKDLIDSVAQGDGIYATGKNAKENFVNSLRVRQNDTQLVEGEETTIPLLYQDNFMYKDKDGQWVSDAASKNADLTNNLVLFSEAVYRKKNMLKIADITESLKMLIEDQKIIKTTATGKVILNEDGTVKTGESSTNAQLFDTLTKGLVYGKRIQNKDAQYGIFGQQLSMNKTITSLMSYMSTKSLAFNYVSGFGNAAAGLINTRIKAKGELYYNSKQMNKAFTMITTRDNRDIWNHAVEFFNVEKDHWIHEKAAKLSASKLTKNLTFDKWYLLQQKGDEMIANTILLSMMQNYGIDENGDVKRLAQLPEGSKSILDRMDRSKDKISVEGMSNEAFDDFRNRVKYVSRSIKGTNTTEDLSKVQTDVRMKAFTHFRNWIAPMVKERFGGLTYTQEVQEFEYGRFKGTWNTVVSESLVKSIPKLMLDIVTLGKIKYKGDVSALETQYEAFKKDNPHLVGTKGMPSLDEYLEMRERALREGLYELKWVVGLATLGLAASSDWDDDGEADYKKNAVTRIAYKLMKRAHLELSFFVDPTSVKELLKSPIPVMQVLQDVQNVVGNTATEATDLIFGQDDKRDQTPIGHYSKKMVPIVKVMFDLFEDIEGPNRD